MWRLYAFLQIVHPAQPTLQMSFHSALKLLSKTALATEGRRQHLRERYVGTLRSFIFLSLRTARQVASTCQGEERR